MLLIAGDLFHRQPLRRELKEVNHLFSGIPDTQIVLIAGNHDYMKKDSYYHTFLWSENVHFIKSRDISCAEFPQIGLAVYGLSYYSREITVNPYENMVPGKKQPVEILLYHGGDAKHMPIQKSKFNTLAFDYIAMGHIHRPQVLLKGRAEYAGALEPVDKNDTGPHGYISGEITEEGCSTEFVPCASREYIHMEVPVTDNMTGYAVRQAVDRGVAENGSQNMYKIILKGFRSPDILFDLGSMDSLGNIVEIEDRTKPAYDFQKLYTQNKDNLLGRFIQSLMDSHKESVEYQALCEGVQALMAARRG